jgi:hypothetical protein
MLDMSKFEGTFKLHAEEGFVEASLDMNGAGIRKWLEDRGVECIDNRDTGRNGLVLTKSGFFVSTNGFCRKY